MAIVTITKDNLMDLAHSEKPVLIDFWAPWCGPCRMIAPIVEEIAELRKDIIVGKLNVDEEMELAAEFGIASIPTLVVLKEGHLTGQLIGYHPKAAILKMLET